MSYDFRSFIEQEITGKALPALEPPSIENSGAEPQTVDSKWAPKQLDTVQQLQAEVRGWRTKHALALKEIDRLKAKVDRSKKKYNVYE